MSRFDCTNGRAKCYAESVERQKGNWQMLQLHTKAGSTAMFCVVSNFAGLKVVTDRGPRDGFV